MMLNPPSRKSAALAVLGMLCSVSQAEASPRAESEMQSLVNEVTRQNGSHLSGLPGAGAPASAKPADPAAIYMQAGADEKQIERIRALVKETENQNIAEAKIAMQALNEIRALSQQAELDAAKLLELQGQVNAAQAKMATAKMQLLIDIRHVLTPEQRVKLATLIQQRRARNETHSQALR